MEMVKNLKTKLEQKLVILKMSDFKLALQSHSLKSPSLNFSPSSFEVKRRFVRPFAAELAKILS